ncbi:MAG: hypothetical protein HY078_08455 [Elusimicrobia bacterium]|nr:hypothetical protein [Elusimicrobiota bacterium]
MHAALSWLAAGLFAAGARAAEASDPAAPSFYYDLGPESIDVSKYPWTQRENYEVFKKNCQVCHTLARPINAPYVDRRDWGKFIREMHVRKKEWTNSPFAQGEAEVVIRFLVFDARIRKIERRMEFEENARRLRAEFNRLKKEGRARKPVPEDSRSR